MEVKLRLRALNENGQVVSEGSAKRKSDAYEKLELDSFRDIFKGDLIAAKLKDIVEINLPSVISTILIGSPSMRSLLVELSVGGRMFWYQKQIK
jgi:hypothetical protein